MLAFWRPALLKISSRFLAFQSFLALGAAASTLFGAAAAGAQGSSGTSNDPLRIQNIAYLTFTGEDGTAGSAIADATVYLQQTAGVALAPPREAIVRPGGRVVFAHRLENLGTGPDRFRLDASAPAKWTAGVYLDVDGDGTLGPGDTPLAGPVALDRGRSAALLFVLDAPADAPEGTAAAQLRATSLFDPLVASTVQDQIVVVRMDARFALAKTVDRAVATPGDTLQYTLVLANTGNAASEAAALADPLPAGLRYVAGSMRLNGLALTDALDGDAGDINGTTVRLAVGAIAPGTHHTLTLRALVTTAASGTVRNVAAVTVGDSTLVSLPAETRIEVAEVSVSKRLLGTDSVRVGEDVTYELGFANQSAIVPLYDAELVDTLPPALAYVSADPMPTSVDGQIVRWRLGTLATGQTGSFDLVVRAVRVPPAGERIVNHVVLSGSNAAAATAFAAPLKVGGFLGSELALAKAAGVLEAGMGDAVPYTLTLTNSSTAPLYDVVVHDRLPDGMSYIPSAMAGADSVRANGRDVTFYVARIAGRGTYAVRYAAAVVAPGNARALENRAVATADEGRLVSDTATAWVRLRRSTLMGGRTLVGKVWIDRNDDGVQQPGEEGVANAHVWSADGQVVTTDVEGRFSFTDLPAGTHALRLDTLNLVRGYVVPRRGDDVAMVRTDGWTTPRTSFRLIPKRDSTTCDLPPVAARGSLTSAATLAAAAPASIIASLLPLPNGRAAAGDSLLARGADTATIIVPAAVAPLRTAADREAEDGRAFLEGPTVRIAMPADGAVVASNRVYFGVRGEPGARVKLYDGETLLREGELRPDGKQDFVGVELAPGPHTVRVWMQGSWEKPRWDSVAVHRSGEPATIEVSAQTLTLRAESPTPAPFTARVLDRWGVPVVGGVHVTVDARGASAEGKDADPSSVGTQLSAGPDGRVAVALKAGRDVGPGEATLVAGAAHARLVLRVYPSARTLIATGAGQIGVGAAAPRDFAAMAVQGALGGDASVTVSYDSRRGQNTDDYFARGYDPLDEARYPTMGDGSERRVVAPSSRQLSMRVERGFDWLEAGDVQTTGLVASTDDSLGTGAQSLLGAYQRSLTGVSARLGAGPMVMRGFGSLTTQSRQQLQLRGDGGSGPYVFGADARPGTERVAIEVRARDNAARVIARQDLSRYTDYQIDYASGAVLLNAPVPAADAYGNPVYVVAMLERRSGGAAHLVGGARLEVDASRFFHTGLDSLSFGVSGVRDAGAGTAGSTTTGSTTGAVDGAQLAGADLHLRRRGVLAEAELLRAASGDSAGVAGRADLRWTLPGKRAALEAGWMRVGGGFATPFDPRLSSALDEVRFGSELRLGGDAALKLQHQRQRFSQYGVERSNTAARAEERVAGREMTQELALAVDGSSASGAPGARTLSGKASVAVTSRLETWAEGSLSLANDDAAAAAAAGSRADQIGAGLTYRLLQGLNAEASQRYARLPGDSAGTYAVSSFGLRAEALFGARTFGTIERAGSARASHSAVLGWNQQLAVGRGWSVTSMFERRFGLSAASLADPVRALPFVQAERDRLSMGAGLEWLPGDDRARFSAHGETHDGADRRGMRVSVSGDAPLGLDAAVLTRHDWSQYHRPTERGNEMSRQDRSLVGLAMRPVGTDAFNALLKLEWKRTLNPLGGTTLATAGQEARLIGATDGVWAPNKRTEVAGRYAVRWASSRLAGVAAPAVAVEAHYFGARAERRLSLPWVPNDRLAARLDGRVLVERASGAAAWGLSPSLALDVGPQLRVEGGYRLGALRDADFAPTGGGPGFFATVGVRFTESVLATPAAFWRERVARD